MKKIIAIVMAGVLFFTAVFIFATRNEDAPVLEPMELYASERIFGEFDEDEVIEDPPEPLPFDVSEVIEGQAERGGYILAPVLFGLSGVDTLSPFVLRTPSEYEALPQILIDGQEQPTVVREDEKTFIVTPAIPLTANSVYVFRLAREDNDITWAFQTAKRFEVVSTLPRNQATNVPVRTGIEISFSYGEEINISDDFNIDPHAEGNFIYRGATTIFTPASALKHGTIYTVTTQGVSFSFETAPAPQTSAWRDWNSRLHFSTNYVEFPTFAAPTVHYWLNYQRDRGRPSIQFDVYRINDRASAIEAVNKLAGAPHWSHFSQNDFLVDVKNLTRVSSTTVNERQIDESQWNESFTLPNNLPAGFYVLDAKPSDTAESRQIIIQITDLAVQVIADEEKALVWVNHMNNGRPVANTRVFDATANKTYEATSYGIAVVERELASSEHLIVSAGNSEAVVFIHPQMFQHFWHWDSFSSWGIHDDWDDGWSPRSLSGWWNPWGSTAAHNQYWTALQLDRTLFQRNDTLSLWGFVQNRRQKENISHITAVLTEQSWWGRGWWGEADEKDPLHRQNISVQNGAYSAEINLPHLDPGSYQIEIFHGDISISSTFFTVMDYVKPPYQMTASADKVAIFAGQEVNFTARTEFFEGTPVPDLEISYDFWGSNLTTPNRNSAKTNIHGVMERSARPTVSGTAQGQRTMTFSAEATLPEIGWVYEQASVRVFINDITVRPRASRDGANATLSVDAYNITLDRLNDGTAEHGGDFLCAPKAGQRVAVQIVEIYWEKIRDGEFYCHVKREVVPRYRYERRENNIERFEITTNAEGFAERKFTVPDRDRRSYEARLTTTDGNGRTISHNVFIGRDWTGFFNQANDTRLFLDGANPEGYDIGDAVELTVMRGDERVQQGNFLFVVVQGGILSYHIGKNPLELTFTAQHVPNAQVFAYHFNGHTYNTGGGMAQRLRYNPAHKNLVINISTDKESYRPGETPTFTITTTDENGNPKAANVNISLVDEALFALMNYTVDTLEMLYRNIDDNLKVSMATHRTFVSDGIEFLYGATDDMEVAEDSVLGRQSLRGANATPAPTANALMAENGGGGETARIRERFEDTAMFASVRTNADGIATLSFPLPDNITSWRVTASAISTDLFAGNTVENISVSLPMFVHYTLNNTFLTGDVPTLGVNAYGTSLTGGEQVEFSVWREDAPNDVRRATGAAFERVNIPLWEMRSEGKGAIIIRANVLTYSDALKHEYQIVNSHRTVDSAIFYNVTPQTVFATNSGGLTNITFTDQGRGQFLQDLFTLRHTWWSGARLEALVARREATALIRKNFPDIDLYSGGGEFNILDYQTENGGIAILPHASADLQATVMLLPFIKDEINLPALRDYLQNIYATSATDNKMLALYGLAILGEPVLLDLHAYAKLENLSVRNTAYVALGLTALGETQAANALYEARIASHIQRVAPLYRVNIGNRAEILDVTSVTALLAARLGKPEALGLHQYATQFRFDGLRDAAGNRADNQQVTIERLKFISYEIENHSNTQARITYTLSGETVTRDLGSGVQFTLRIPAANMNQFRLTSVNGEVGAVSIVRTPLEDITTVENDIAVRREFFRGDTDTRATTFAQDEIIRVQITVDYSARDLSGTYVITDFLPAGLVHVPNSARFDSRSQTVAGSRAWATTEGARITFYDHNSRFHNNRTYHYYARVVNPGTFRAEGTIVQSLGAREYMVVGEDTTITIR
jgi:hypothetical protein